MRGIPGVLAKCGVDERHYDARTHTLRGGMRIQRRMEAWEWAALEEIVAIEGELVIQSPEIESLDGFNRLRRLGGLVVRGSRRLESISGFRGVERLRSLTIDGNAELKEIRGFGRLFRKMPIVEGAIKITDNRQLESVAFLAGLKRVNSSLYLHHNRLGSLAGLEALERVEASLSLSSNRLTGLRELGRLNRVDGMLGVVNNRLETLDGLERLRRVGTVKWNRVPRSVALHNNPVLSDIGALAGVTTPDGFMIVICDEFERFTTLPDASSPFFQNMLEVRSRASKRVVRMGGRTTFPKIVGIRAHNVQSGNGFELENLILGQGVGFEARAPYGRISRKYWSTQRVGNGGAHYFDRHGPIVIDLKLYEMERFDGIAIWSSRVHFGNSIKDFTIQFSATHDAGGLGPPVARRAEDRNPFDVELFPFPPVEANFARLTILSNHHEEGVGGHCVDFQEIAFVRDTAALQREIDAAAGEICDHDFIRPLIGSSLGDRDYNVLTIAPEFSLDHLWRPEMTYRDFISARGLGGAGPQLRRINLSRWGDKIYMHHFLKQYGIKGMPVRLWTHRFDGDFMRRVREFHRRGLRSFVLKVSHLGDSMGVYRVREGRHVAPNETWKRGARYGTAVDFDYLEQEIRLHLKSQQYHEDWVSNMISPGVLLEEFLEEPTEIKFSVVFGEVVGFFLRENGFPSFDARGEPLTDLEVEPPPWWREARALAERLARIIRADHLRIDLFRHRGEVIVCEVNWNGGERRENHPAIADALNYGYALRRAHRRGVGRNVA